MKSRVPGGLNTTTSRLMSCTAVRDHQPFRQEHTDYGVRYKRRYPDVFRRGHIEPSFLNIFDSSRWPRVIHRDKATRSHVSTQTGTSRKRKSTLRMLLDVHFMSRCLHHGSLNLSNNASRISRSNVKCRNILPQQISSRKQFHDPNRYRTRMQHTLVTTLPAPMVTPLPIVTPGSTMTLPPNQQSSPM